MKKYLSLLVFMLLINWSNTFGQACTIGDEKLVIKVDANGNFGAYAFSWTLTDSNGVEVLGYTTNQYTDLTVTTDSVCLTTGEQYTFEAYSEFGTGWNENGNSIVSIYYPDDEFPIYYDSPSNFNSNVGEPEAAVTFTMGAKPGLDCTQPKVVDIYKPELLITNAFNTNTNFTTSDSGKDIILSFTPPNDDNYKFSLYDVGTPTNVSLQLLTDCIDGAPSLLGSGESSVSQEPVEFGASLTAGTNYYLLFSNNATIASVDTAQARFEITYNTPPAADNCNSQTVTMDGASFTSRFANATSSGSQIAVNTAEGFFFQAQSIDINFDFNVLDTNLVVEVSNYPKNAELFAQISFGGCPSGSTNYRNVTFEGTTRRIDFNLNPAEFGGTASLRLAPGAGNAVNTPFTIKVRSRANVLSEFSINANNDCSSAAAVGVNTLNDYFGGVYPKGVQLSNYNATNSGLAAPCSQDSVYTGTTGDVWVKAIVPETGIMAIKVEGEYVDLSNTSPLKIAWALYRGTCGSLTEYYCPPIVESYQADSVGGLTYREEVYIRLFDRGGLREGDFSVKIQEVEKLTDPQISFQTYPDSITLQINTVDFIFDDYLLDVSVDSFSTFLPTYEAVAIDRNATQFTINGLTPNQTYFVRVKKRSSNLGDSEYFSSSVQTEPNSISTIASGNWNNPAIWSGGIVPPVDSAAIIYHRVTVPPGSDITIEKLSISHTQLTTTTVALFIQDANFTVKRDVLMEEFGEISSIDTIGVFISNGSVSNKLVTINGNVDISVTNNFETQFMFFAQNFSTGNLSVNIGKAFNFNNDITFALTEYGENILLEDVEFNAYSFNIRHDDGISPQRQSFKGRVTNSIMNIENSFSMNESTSDFSTFNTYEMLFDGTSILDLAGDFYKPSGGVLRFTEGSTLILSGTRQQNFDVFDPLIGQDSTILNNLIISSSYTGETDRARGYTNPASIYFAGGSTASGQLLVNGQLSFQSGIVKPTNGLDDFSIELVINETASLDPGYDPSSNSYFTGPITKYGLTDFIFPVGNELGSRVLGFSNFTATLPNSLVKVMALSNACEDSTFNTAGIANPRVLDYWQIESPVQEPSVTADFTPTFADLTKEGISNIASLRLINFTDGVNLGNNISTANSFTSSYNFDNGPYKSLGIGSIDNTNSFYKTKSVNTISSFDVAVGDNITFTYSGNFASVNDKVYFEQIEANTLSATANSITVEVPVGARSGEPVILLGDDEILQLSTMINVREVNIKPIVAEQYDSLLLIDNIGAASFGESKLIVSDIDLNATYDVVALKQAGDSIYFLKDIAGTVTNSYYFFPELKPGEQLYYRDINVGLSNAFGSPSIDVATYVQLYEQQIQVYLFNDGLGNFGIAETEASGLAPKIRSPFIRDLNGDGFSDFNFSLETSDINFNGIYTTAFDSNLSCSPYVVNPLYGRGDKNVIKEISYGNFSEIDQTLYYTYVPNPGELVLQDPSLPTNNTVASLNAVSSSLTDFHKASINRNSKAQFLALDTVNNAIEIFDGFTNGTILNNQIALAFSPGRMAIEDLNGDGYVDIVVSERNSPNLYFYQNDAAGGFSLVDTKLGTTPNILDLEIVDANKDGDRDLVILFENGDISVAYFNKLALPAAPLVVASNITTAGFDLKWLPASGAAEYQIEVSLSSDTLISLATDSLFTLADTLLSFSAPTKFETYYVFARGINLAGDTSAYASPVQVDLAQLATPIVTVAALDANQLEFNLTAAEAADSYQLFISLDSSAVANQPTDTLLAVAAGVSQSVVPEYSEMYHIYVRSIASGVDTTALAYVTSSKLPVSSYLVQDSLALVALYQNNNGINWTDQTGWLTDKVNKWFGVEMNGDTIRSISLANNNLNGSLTDSLAIMNHLLNLDVSNNELTNVGGISGLVGQLLNVNVSNNLLNFEELEKLISVPNYSFANQVFQYALVKDTIINLSDNILFSPNVTASANNYQWYKNGSAIAAELSASLPLNNVTKVTEGQYFLEVTNSLLSGLTFYTDTVDFKVSTLDRDISALKALYTSTNGASWSSITWDTTQVDPANWNASATDIIVENNRIVEVRLPNNNLTGNVSALVSQMLGLRAIDFSGNAIEGLPRLSTLPNLTSLDVDGNKLGYEDLEPNISINGFSFEDQQAFGDPINIEQQVGSSYAIQFTNGGTANTYQWFRNTQAVTGALADSIRIDSLVYTNMGKYHLEIGNSIVNANHPDFRLSSAVTTILATAGVSGKVTDANAFPTTSGKYTVFEITSEGSYDTVRFANNVTEVALNNDGSYSIGSLRLGDYLLVVKPSQNNFPDLLPTYYTNTIDWDVADTLKVRTNLSDVDIIMEGTPQALNGSSMFSGYVEVEVPATTTGRYLPRQRVGGAGVSVRRIGNSNKGISVFNGELVAYILTDENGEFEVPNLPAGDYISKVDYPGIPMNESSDIRFTFTGENLESLEVAAIVDNGVCTMETILYTGSGKAVNAQIEVYPNPFENSITLSGDIQELNNVIIFDLRGQLVKVLTANELGEDKVIDMANMPSGIYIVNLNWQNGSSSSSKIIKK